MKNNELLSLKNISLTYGAVNALEDVNLTIQTGEIHALIGEHGAGKSSLAHIMSGFTRSAGTIYWKGRSLPQISQRTARDLGINFVTQGTELFNHLPIAFNLFNNDPNVFKGFLFNQRKIFQEAKEYLESCGCVLNPKQLVGELSLPEKVMVDVLRHIYRKPKLLILDEALEKLTAIDLNIIRKLLRVLRNNGSSIIFITHRIDDVYEFADRVTILRNGRIMVTDTVKNIDKINLIKLAYTQIAKTKGFAGVDKEFYHLLKYNEAILEFLPIALLVVDRSSRIKLFNNFGENLFRQDRDKIINRKLDSLLGGINQKVYTEIKVVLDEGGKQTLYSRELSLNAMSTACNIVIYPIMDGNYYIGSIIIIDDITEQEKLREKINFSEKLASVGLLAAGVAHEINNPLEIVGNYLDVLKTQNSNDESKQYISYIEEELYSIENIVGNLITFSEKNKYEDEVLALRELICRMFKLIKPNSEMRGIELIFQKGQEEYRISANRTKMKQVILNIIKNAFDAMSEGGKLEIRLERTAACEVLIRFLDTGGGIEEGNLNDLFLPFYTTKDGSEENMGLGLSIVYGIIDGYGGKVEAVNRIDRQGCEVRVYLPGINVEN